MTGRVDSTGLLAGRRARLFFIHMPIVVSGVLWVIPFTFVARDWSDQKAVAAELGYMMVWAVFVVIPLVTLIAPTKERP